VASVTGNTALSEVPLGDVNRTTMTLTAAWNILLQRYSHVQIEFFGNLVVQLLCFWVPSAFYISLPYIFPNFSARSKLQKEEKQPTPAELWECLALVSRNQLLSCALHLALLSLNTRLGAPSSYRFEAELPGLAEIVRDVVICALAREVLFYYIHYTLHQPYFYAKFHKRHHHFTAPVALAAQYVSDNPLQVSIAAADMFPRYASKTEHLLANILPVIIPPMVLRTHIVGDEHSPLWVCVLWWIGKESRCASRKVQRLLWKHWIP